MKQNYIIIGIVIIILLVGGMFAWQKKGITPTPTTVPPTSTPTIPTTTPTPTKPAGWKTYENKEFGFAFDYPGKWEVGHEKTNIPYAVAYLVSPEMKMGIQRYPYGGEFGDIYFVVQDLGSLSLEGYLQRESKKAYGASYSYRKITLKRFHVYEVISGEASLDYAIAIEKSGKLYEIFFRNKASWNNLSTTEQKIIESFRFL